MRMTIALKALVVVLAMARRLSMSSRAEPLRDLHENDDGARTVFKPTIG
jgi:hypothetical protein